MIDSYRLSGEVGGIGSPSVGPLVTKYILWRGTNVSRQKPQTGGFEVGCRWLCVKTVGKLQSQVNLFNISYSTWEYHRHYLIKALSRCPYAQEIEESSKNVRHFICAISRRVTIVRQVHAGGCRASSACPFHYEHAIIARESIWSCNLRSCFALAAQPIDCSSGSCIILWRSCTQVAQLLRHPRPIIGLNARVPKFHRHMNGGRPGA